MSCLPVNLMCLLFAGLGAGGLFDSSTDAVGRDDPMNVSLHYQLFLGPADMPIEIMVADGRATLIRRRAIAESGGEPIGVFRMEIGPERIDCLVGAFPRSVENQAPIAPGMPNLRFRMQRADETADFRIAHRPDSLTAVKGLVTELEKLEKDLLKKPYRTVRLELTAPQVMPVVGKRFDFRVRFQNDGSQSAAIVINKDAVWFEFATDKQRRADPNKRLEWRRLDVVVAERELELPARGSMEVALGVELPEAGASYVRSGFTRRAELDADQVQLAGHCVSKPIVLDVRPE